MTDIGRVVPMRLVRTLTCLFLAAVPWALASPDCPKLLSPAPGEVMPNGRLDGLVDAVWTFRWKGCEGADAYGVVVTSRSGDLVSESHHGVRAPKFTMTREAVEDAWLEGWTWQVRAWFGDEPGPYSEERPFTVEPSHRVPLPDFGPPADCPVLLEPVPGAVMDNGRVDRFDELAWPFAWTPCPGASEYWLLALREGAPSALVSRKVYGHTRHEEVVLTYVAESELSGWTWRVRANVDGIWQGWSAPVIFSVEPPDTDPAKSEWMAPLPMNPRPGSLLPNVGGYPDSFWNFEWRHVPIAEAYRFVVTAPHLTDPYLDVMLDDGWISSNCRYGCWFETRPEDTPLPAQAGSWSWRVEARWGATWGPSEEVAFRVGPPPGGAEAWIEGRLEGWSEGTAPVAGWGYFEFPPVGDGTLAPDGTFRLHLPALALDAGNFRATGADGPLRVAFLTTLVVGLEEGWGGAVLGTSARSPWVFWGGLEDCDIGDALVTWWFFDRDATVPASEFIAYPATDRAIGVRHGWNTVLLRVVERGGERRVAVESVTALPDDVAWHWLTEGD
jgi:hypothetical protein